MAISCSSVCTLFEGHYHYGLAALVNSLYRNNYRGNVYAGYKGNLPNWANKAEKNPEIFWDNASTMQIQQDLFLHFLPVTEKMHMANYKPHFMLALNKHTHNSIFYFDPDIVVKCDWNFFEEWIHHGVAVVQEIVSNNFSPRNPKRMQWLPVIEKSGRKVERELHHILNSGFCGVSDSNTEFLETWISIFDTAVKYFNYHPDYFEKISKLSDVFVAGDQDMMNITSMCSQSPISDIGPEGMDFVPGGWLMSHSTGNPKPWKLNYIQKALKGKGISLPEKNYWDFANYPIRTYSGSFEKRKKLSIKAASLIGRFYKRS